MQAVFFPQNPLPVVKGEGYAILSQHDEYSLAFDIQPADKRYNVQQTSCRKCKIFSRVSSFMGCGYFIFSFVLKKPNIIFTKTNSCHAVYSVSVSRICWWVIIARCKAVRLFLRLVLDVTC